MTPFKMTPGPPPRDDPPGSRYLVLVDERSGDELRGPPPYYCVAEKAYSSRSGRAVPWYLSATLSRDGRAFDEVAEGHIRAHLRLPALE